MHETAHQPLVRGCLNFPLAFLLYLVIFIGTQIGLGIGGITVYSLFLGLPILVIAALTVAVILLTRDRLPPVPASLSMPITLLTSMTATVSMFLPLLFRTDLSAAAILASLIALSSFLAGLSAFGYAEVVRDQFPPGGGRRTDAP